MPDLLTFAEQPCCSSSRLKFGDTYDTAGKRLTKKNNRLRGVRSFGQVYISSSVIGADGSGPQVTPRLFNLAICGTRLADK